MAHNIQFDEEEFSLHTHKEPQSGMINFMVQHKLATNSTQASLLLLIGAIMLLILAVFITFRATKSPQPPSQPDPASLLSR